MFIADESGRQLDTRLLPDEVAVSVMTLAELELGVHMASSAATRARRLQTLQAVRSAYVAIPIDERVVSSFAGLVGAARGAGRRPKVQDAWIAATANAHGVAVYTQDDDFDAFGIDVVHV